MDLHHLDPTTGEPPAEIAQHFQGTARLQRLSSPFLDGPDVFAVHFDAGGRTRPHTHSRGQVLVITEGEGIVASAADGRRTVHRGDVVVVEPGEWHWHGAGPHTDMTHVTIQTTGPGSIDWDVAEGDWAHGYGPSSGGQE